VSAVTPGVAFVGRDPELDAVAAFLATGERPPGSVLLVTGPAGVGKTRLVDEALRRAAGTAVVRGYCHAETAPPLWPWRAALRRAGAEIAREPDVEPAAAKSAWFAALAQMSDALIAKTCTGATPPHWTCSPRSEPLRAAPASLSSAPCDPPPRTISTSAWLASAVTAP
jgi:hypothetical protein